MSAQTQTSETPNLSKQVWDELKLLLTVAPTYIANETSARLAYSFIRYLVADAAEANVNIDPKLLSIIVGALEKAMKETVGNISAPAAAMLAMLSTIGGLLTIANTQQLQQTSSEKQ
ncbi:MAG: hypothetical protein L7H00_03385 [Vulcanisaeta sp.]|nr:hypothetical protein [Vulcanisaeta sp.]